jgi:hypothetical protein
MYMSPLPYRQRLKQDLSLPAKGWRAAHPGRELSLAKRRFHAIQADDAAKTCLCVQAREPFYAERHCMAKISKRLAYKAKADYSNRRTRSRSRLSFSIEAYEPSALAEMQP